jgi:hypothetical protein
MTWQQNVPSYFEKEKKNLEKQKMNLLKWSVHCSFRNHMLTVKQLERVLRNMESNGEFYVGKTAYNRLLENNTVEIWRKIRDWRLQ